MRSVTLCLAVCILTACTSIQVQPLSSDSGVDHVCIKNNPKVIVGDFLSVIRTGFSRHGISTEVFAAEKPADCEVTLTYTALQSWDFSPYLSHAELYLWQDGLQIASARYHLIGKGGFSLTKWAGTKEKMQPVIDKLLKAY